MDRHDYANGSKERTEDKMRGIVQECRPTVKLHGLVYDGLGSRVALEDVALEHLPAIARQGHEIVSLYLQEC